jgi:hypothetical protein
MHVKNRNQIRSTNIILDQTMLHILPLEHICTIAIVASNDTRPSMSIDCTLTTMHV